MSEKTTKFVRCGDSDQMIPASYNEHLNLKLKYFSQMKKVLTAAILAVTTCAFIGCTKNEVRSISDNPQAVRFLPLNGKHSTKVMVGGTTYPDHLPFGTLAYYLPSGKNWNTNKADATLYIPISKVVNKSGATSGSAWEVEGKTYYWPKSGSLTFFAYSPFAHEDGTLLAVDKVSNGTHDNGIHILDYDVHVHQATDFMVADIAMDKTANESNGGYTGVPIVFRHKLSQIVGINFQTVINNTTGSGPALVEHDYANNHSEIARNLEAGDVVFKLKKVEVQNLYTVGNYVYSGTDDGWMNPTTKKDYIWFKKENAPEAFAGNTTFELKYNTQYTDRNEYLLVLPQDLINPFTTTLTGTDPLIHIEYQVLTYSDATNHSTEDVSENVYLYDIHNSATKLEKNKKITYNFKINLANNKIYWAPSVENWEGVTYDNIEIK